MIKRWLSDQNLRLRGHLLAGYYGWRLALGQENGVTNEQGDVPLIVSLTSTAKRIGRVHLAISSLLSQSHKADQIILWLSDSLDGKNGFELTAGLKRAVAKGLSIKYRPDIGPFTKLNYALREFPDAVIVTADDDKMYPEKWLEALYRSYQANPHLIHAHRVHRMTLDSGLQLNSYMNWEHRVPGVAGPSHQLFATGTGGVLYPPQVMPDEVFNEAKFRAICWPNDDIWYKAMALLQGVEVQKVGQGRGEFITIPGTQDRSLWVGNQTLNDELIHAVFQEYNLFDYFYRQIRQPAMRDGK